MSTWLQYGAWSVRAADRWEVKAELREKRGAAGAGVRRSGSGEKSEDGAGWCKEEAEPTIDELPPPTIARQRSVAGGEVVGCIRRTQHTRPFCELEENVESAIEVL